MYAAKPPALCPECGEGRGLDPEEYPLCDTCESLRSDLADWQATLRRRQREFRDDVFPLMVATKGYGMGIDKRNIRFVVHQGLSSGIEGYYQEAGRAGRDSRHAHIALTYVRPHPDCRRKHINVEPGEPPCRDWKCHADFGLPSLCHYGLQAHLLRFNYPGTDKELSAVKQAWGHVKAGRPLAHRDGEGEHTQSASAELAMYRLQQVGAVTGYSVDYRRKTLQPQAASDSYTQVLKGERAPFQPREWAANVAHQVTTQDREQAYSELESRLLKCGHNEDSFVEQAASAIIDTVYSVVKRMRYQMLRNELEYATQDECRRIYLRATFDEQSSLLPKTYRCEFCDVCRPDLIFDREQAVVPPEDMEAQQVAEQLDRLVDIPLCGEHPAWMQRVVERDFVTGALARVTHRLERPHIHAAAYYMAGRLELARQRIPEARSYLEQAFLEAVAHDESVDALLLCADAAADQDSTFEGVLELAVAPGGPLDSLEGISRLIDIARKKTRAAQAAALEMQHRLAAMREVDEMLAQAENLVARATDEQISRLANEGEP